MDLTGTCVSSFWNEGPSVCLQAFTCTGATAKCYTLGCPVRINQGTVVEIFGIWYQSEMVLIGKIYSKAMLFWLLKPRFTGLFVSGETFVFLLCAFVSQFLPYISVTPISVISENLFDIFWNMSSLNMSDSALLLTLLMSLYFLRSGLVVPKIFSHMYSFIFDGFLFFPPTVNAPEWVHVAVPDTHRTVQATWLWVSKLGLYTRPQSLSLTVWLCCSRCKHDHFAIFFKAEFRNFVTRTTI